MKRMFTLTAVCVVLAACEGAGGGGSSNINSRSYAPIDSSSADELTGSAMQGVSGADGASSQSFSADMATQRSLLALASSRAELYRLKGAVLQSDASGSGVSYDQLLEYCDEGGSYTVTGGDDWFQLDFDQCAELGEVTNGAIRFDLYSNTYELEDLKLTFSNLAVSAGGNTDTMNGDLRMRDQVEGAQNTYTLSSDFLDSTSTSLGNSEISNFLVTGVDIMGASSSTLSMSYAMGSDEIGGRVDISTPEVFSYENDDQYPTSGIMRVDGASGAYIELDASTGDVNTVDFTINDGSSSATTETIDWSSLSNSDLSAVAF